MRRFRSIVLLIILTGATSPIFPQSPAHGIKNVFWQPNELQQGSVAFITVELDRVPRRVTGKWIGKDLAFFKSDNPKIWYALAGADLETQPKRCPGSASESAAETFSLAGTGFTPLISA
jgi:hypothetical protein